MPDERNSVALTIKRVGVIEVRAVDEAGGSF